MFFYIAKYVMRIGMHFLYRLKVTGKENIPKNGSFIICGNHTHAMDPVVITVSIRRRLYFMGKKELFKRKFFDFFLRQLGVYPVDRGTADMKAFKKTVEILNGGNGLMLFAQGHRTKEFTGSKNGTALFALKTNSPIVPVGISGEYKFRSKIKINIGKPISMDEHKDKKIKTELVEEVMENLVSQIRGLME